MNYSFLTIKKILLSFLMLAYLSLFSSKDINDPINDVEKRTKIIFRTYMTPSIPQGFYQLIVDYLNEKTDFNVSLSIELEYSGPPPNQPDPFITGEIHLAQMCAPAFIKLIDQKEPSIELLGLAPIFDDPRAEKKPVYFSDIIVAADSTIQSFDDLKGRSWCYNDLESLSGYFCMLQHLTSIHKTTDFFSNVIQSGGHLQSLNLVAQGKVDVAAIDSNGLLNFLHLYPEFKNKIRVIKSLGPYPIQPFVVSKKLPQEVKDKIKQALLTMTIEKKEELATFFSTGFGIVTDQHYNQERQLLISCKHLI